MNWFDKSLEDYNPLLQLHIIYFSVLVFLSIFILKSIIIGLCVFIFALANLYEREDFDENNWFDEEDEGGETFDDEEQVEGFLEEDISENVMDFITSEYIEEWNVYNKVIPSDFFFVDLNNQYKSIDLVEKIDIKNVLKL